MLTIYGGAEHFWQWDTERQLLVETESACEVHFYDPDSKTALIVDTYKIDEKTVANVPNKLLQKNAHVIAWVYVRENGAQTKHEARFSVWARQRPADYVYTETEVKSFAALETRVEKLEGAQKGNFGIIKRVLVGYEILYEKPDDWDNNYSSFYNVSNVGLITKNAQKTFFAPDHNKLLARHIGGEATKELVINADTQGNSFALFDTVMLVHCPLNGVSGAMMDWHFRNSDKEPLARSVVRFKNTAQDFAYPQHIAARSIFIGGAHFALSFDGQHGDVANTYGASNCSPIGHTLVMENNKITQAEFFIYPDIDIPEGTYVELWGVRANA